MLAGLIRVISSFPWADAWDATLDANALWLTLALAVNLFSLVTKGWAWQLLLLPGRRVSWRAAAGASGAMRAIEEPAAAAPAAGKEMVEAEKKESAPRASQATKSLQCKECGTLNLPTAWDCERFGAELAAP